MGGALNHAEAADLPRIRARARSEAMAPVRIGRLHQRPEGRSGLRSAVPRRRWRAILRRKARARQRLKPPATGGADMRRRLEPATDTTRGRFGRSPSYGVQLP